ncbi:MAG: lysylphosphatidylglycerol synthase transmembrane domain-containing protein [Bacteroidia bacterium]
MNPFIKKVLKFLLFLGIGVGLVYLIVSKITPDDWKNIKIAAVNANYLWIALSLVIGVFSHLLRAMRWRMLIEPIDKKPGLANTFSAVMIGYMANYAVPRLGEVSRCGVLNRYEAISFAGLIGTVVVERIIDMLLMLLFFLVMLLLSFGKVYGIIKTKATSVIEGKWDSLKHVNPLILIAVAVILIGGVWFLYKKKDSLFEFAKKFIDNFLGGIKSVGNLKKPFLFWFYSLAIWILYLLMLYVCFFCFSETSHLTLIDALVVLVFATFGVIAPVPGGIGAYQYIVIAVLTHLYFISYTKAFTLAWIIWVSQLVLIVTLGLISLVLLPLLNKNDKAGSVTIENSN